MTGIEETLNKQAPAVNGVSELLAQISPTSVAVTALIVALGYGITWWVKRIFRERDLQHKVPNWVNILMRVLLPLLLWLFAHVAMEVYHRQNFPPSGLNFGVVVRRVVHGSGYFCMWCAERCLRVRGARPSSARL